MALNGLNRFSSTMPMTGMRPQTAQSAPLSGSTGAANNQPDLAALLKQMQTLLGGGLEAPTGAAGGSKAANTAAGTGGGATAQDPFVFDGQNFAVDPHSFKPGDGTTPQYVSYKGDLFKLDEKYSQKRAARGKIRYRRQTGQGKNNLYIQSAERGLGSAGNRSKATPGPDNDKADAKRANGLENPAASTGQAANAQNKKDGTAGTSAAPPFGGQAPSSAANAVNTASEAGNAANAGTAGTAANNANPFANLYGPDYFSNPMDYLKYIYDVLNNYLYPPNQNKAPNATQPSYPYYPEEKPTPKPQDKPNEKKPTHKVKTKMASPLVMDLNGNGIKTTGPNRRFDIDGDGQMDRISKVGRDDATLVFDADGDGKFGENGKELFGDNTDINGDGQADGFANGFEALSVFAGKHLGSQAVADGKLDAAEIRALEAKGLKMQVGGREKSLSQAGVDGINLGFTENDETDAHGNAFRQQGSFTRNGREQDLIDVWFAKK